MLLRNSWGVRVQAVNKEINPHKPSGRRPEDLQVRDLRMTSVKRKTTERRPKDDISLIESLIESLTKDDFRRTTSVGRLQSNRVSQ